MIQYRYKMKHERKIKIMTKFINCEIKPAHITLRLTGGIATYQVYGYVLTATNEAGVECIELQPADRRYAPVMRVPKSNVASCEVVF